MSTDNEPDRRPNRYSASEVAELRDATHNLSAQVAGLSEALGKVNELQRRQDNQELAIREVKDETHDQKALAEHIVGHLETVEDKAKTSFRRWRVLLATAVVGAVVFISLVLFFWVENHNVKADIKDACQQRQDSLQVTVTRETGLAKADPNPTTAAIHSASATGYQKLIHPC